MTENQTEKSGIEPPMNSSIEPSIEEVKNLLEKGQPAEPEQNAEAAPIAETDESTSAEPEIDPEIDAEEQRKQDELNALKKWFVVHTLSGHEQKVRNNLQKRIETMNMKTKIFTVLVPTEEEVEIKNGKKKIVQRKIFPGYVLVEMIMGDDSWYVVRNTAGVTGFVGSGTKPLPLPDEEVKQILKQTSGEAPKRRLTLKTGDKVRVTSGPFVEFYGAIQEVNPEKEKIKVAVSIFGRETPVELDYGQVEKL